MARSKAFDDYMSSLQQRGAPRAGQAAAYLLGFNVLLIAIGLFGWYQLEDLRAQPQPVKPLTKVHIDPATLSDRVPVIMLSGTTQAVRNAREQSIKRQAQLLSPTQEATPDTVTFTRDVVQDVVREEVESLIFKFVLAERVGRYVQERLTDQSPEPQR